MSPTASCWRRLELSSAERARLLHQLRVLRDDAVYAVKRLAASDRTEALGHGLSARARAATRLLEADGALAVREVRHAAERSASSEPGASELRGSEVQRRAGELAAERAQLDARLLAELDAMDVTWRLLHIRRSAL